MQKVRAGYADRPVRLGLAHKSSQYKWGESAQTAK